MLLRNSPTRTSPSPAADRDAAWDEADRLLNDPEATPDPARIWELLALAAAPSDGGPTRIEPKRVLPGSSCGKA